MNNKKGFKTILLTLIGGFIGGILVFILFLGFHFLTNDTEKNDAHSTGNVLDQKSEKYNSVNSMIKNTSPSVVGVINMQKADTIEEILKGKSTKEQPSGIGSGVVIKKNKNDAYIVTNNHVVEDATDLKVYLNNDRKVKADLVGTDPLNDIAVLKIKNTDDIKAIDFADSSKVKTGDNVFAMGNPLGLQFSNTVTSGIISASEREITVPTSEGKNKTTVLQTDAAINPGNSGGALVNLNGELVGVNSMKISSVGVEGIGFSIPSNEVKSISEELIKNGEINRSKLGISLINLNDIPEIYLKDLDINQEKGVYVAEVQKKDSKLKEGDVISKINNSKVENSLELREYLYNKTKPGDKVELQIVRNGKKQTITVKTT